MHPLKCTQLLKREKRVIWLSGQKVAIGKSRLLIEYMTLSNHKGILVHIYSNGQMNFTVKYT